MTYTGKIVKLTHQRHTGLIEYQDESGEIRSIFFYGYITPKEANYRQYWMGDDKVSFTIEENEIGPIAKIESYLGNDKLDAFMDCDIEDGDTMDGVLVEFNKKPYFIDNDYGIVFVVKTKKTEIVPGKNISATVILKKKNTLRVELLESTTDPEVLRLQSDAETKNMIKADIVDDYKNKCRIRLCDYDIEGNMINPEQIPYEPGDWLYVKVYDISRLKFVPLR